MEHRSNLNIFGNIRGQFMKVQRRDSKFKGACEPVSDHPRRRIATPTLQGHLNDVKYFHRMAPTTQSRGIKYRLAAPHAMQQSKPSRTRRATRIAKEGAANTLHISAVPIIQ
ncbi:hypothetical protein TcCL_ESM07054 [Trypanosoma cruzi]|nr:hypothetical protein TcCL_ESM07054 [Trypanosoma cruzi]